MRVNKRFRVIGLGLMIALLLPLYGIAGAAPPDSTASPPELRIITPLTQNWRFIQNDKLSEQAALKASGRDWETVNLPHTWNAEDAATLNATKPYKRDLGWYRLEFDTPAEGERHWLEFGAASIVADVWLNGEKLGQHRGAFTLFRFDVTDQLRARGRNVLLVKTDNRRPTNELDPTAVLPIDGDFNFSGGLYRHVALVSTRAPAHIDLGDFGGPGVYATTTDISDGSAVVNVRTRLRNDGTEAGEYTLRVALRDADGQIARSEETRVRLPAGGGEEVTQELQVDKPRLWQGREDPYLYTLSAELLGPDGKPVDSLSQQYGIRQVHIDPDKGFILNGKPLQLNGVAMHQDYLGSGWAMTREQMEESMAIVEEIGANALRLGHYPFDLYVLQMADRIGLVVWSEVPYGITSVVVPPLTSPASETACPQHDPTPEIIANIEQQLKEQIRQRYNHASIAVWSVGNEVTFYQGECDYGRWHDNFTFLLRRLHGLARQEDPSRLTTMTTHTDEVEEPTAGGYISAGGNANTWGLNKYYLWYGGPVDGLGVHLDALHLRYPDQPISMSEYGAGAAISHHTDNVRGGPQEAKETPGLEVTYQPEEYGAWVHEQNYAMLLSKDYLWGTFVWNLFDFGSGLRQEGDVQGVNTKGLVTFDRKTRKDGFFFYKANWSEEPVTYIAGRRHTERPYPVADIKVYSNADTVRLTVNGEAVGELSREECPLSTCLFRNVRLGVGTNEISVAGDHGGERVTDSVEWSRKSEDIHIAAGQMMSGLTADDGTRFGSDHFFLGGEGQMLFAEGEQLTTAGVLTQDLTPVSGTEAPDLYRNVRRGRFGYDVPLADGDYEVTLRFLEPDAHTQVGHRLFDVLANGEVKLSNFDVLQAADGQYRRVVTRSFPVSVQGGRLRLEFLPVRSGAVLSNLSIRRQ